MSWAIHVLFMCLNLRILSNLQKAYSCFGSNFFICSMSVEEFIRVESFSAGVRSEVSSHDPLALPAFLMRLGV